MRHIIKDAFIDAGATAVYIIGVASFMTHSQRLFGDEPKGILIPVTMLLLLVISAAITGGLVAGRPILWYMDGKCREAVSLFVSTLAFLALFVTMSAAAMLL